MLNEPYYEEELENENYRGASSSGNIHMWEIVSKFTSLFNKIQFTAKTYKCAKVFEKYIEMICLVIKTKSENCSNCSNISCNMYSNLTEHDWTLATGYLDTQHNIHYSQPTIIFPKINPYLFVKHARYIPLFIFLPVTLPWRWQKAANINFLFFQLKHIIMIKKIISTVYSFKS